MRPMLPEVREFNQRFLDTHAPRYPFWVRLPRARVNPKQVQAKLPELAFICAPVGDYTEWRFISEEGRRCFLAHYTETQP